MTNGAPRPPASDPRIERARQLREFLSRGREALCARSGCSSRTCPDFLPLPGHHAEPKIGTHCLRLEAYEYREFLRNTVGVPDRYLTATFENAEDDFRNHSERTSYANAVRYVEDYARNLREGRNILLHGPLGGGKTFLATAILNALVDRGVTALWRTADGLVGDLLASFDRRDGSTDALRQRLRSAKVLLIDEWGDKIASDVARAELASLINERYNRRNPIIITTNLRKEALEQLPDDYQRMRDRIEHRGESFRVSLRSYRRPANRPDPEVAE